ncbi:uncharacterized protein BO97DRAFT_386335 [Aspergillus homomorphus CBS 101889]|uniref:Aminoglycoside phosphotransferase domain-containing protein n=1 Tax=Aspergillus homomorphus (strain CBS 101889) TaxID=1450537 RepID=A0A395I4A8_ASPHC|nr:hypothetical protein BO97DRAFT_386335 [Aspergillus homomorphus CBS 101889]RAL14569.1 hypothetical protein BO97DRAFT_386335 [Aspergillus homomorphus CBS 101889]
MQRALPLLHGQVTLFTALDDDDNVLQELSYPELRLEFYIYLYQHRTVIESIVSYHLNLHRKQTCRVGEVKDWIAGSFNVCIPVEIDGHDENAPKRVLIRFPLPYKVGEIQHPGNADEKLRCEAATFIWIRQNCPSIPMPRLRGFAFAQGPCFTAIEHVPILSRLKWYFHRVVSFLFGYAPRPPYLSRNCPFSLTTGYLIMDHVGSTDTMMLSESWNKLRHDQDRRANLFRGLSQIILSLAQFPFDRIGSLTIDDQGIIKHTNRPLTLRLHHLENESVPTYIDGDFTYSTSDSYFMDLLSCHDSRLRHAPNSIRNKADGEAQLSTLTIMRALLPHFSCRRYRQGPFIMTLTDLHQSNLFVDSNWNIKSLVDLEWTCSLPVEMLHPPYWLTGRGVDQLYEGEHLDAFSKIHAEFMNVFEEEEEAHSRAGNKTLGLSGIMRKGWKLGSFWYFHALETPKGLYNIFLDHIQPRFSKLDDAGLVEFERTISPYWAPDVQRFLDGKIKELETYEGQLRDAFAGAHEEPPNSGPPSAT